MKKPRVSDSDSVEDDLINEGKWEELVAHLKQKNNNATSLDFLSPQEHYSYLKRREYSPYYTRPSLSVLCNQYGFKVYRSIAKDMEYWRARLFFEECKEAGVPILVDNEEVKAYWKEQKKRWRQDIFYDDPRLVSQDTPLSSSNGKTYRVVVYGSESEYRDSEGYARPYIIYDIEEARVESIKFEPENSDSLQKESWYNMSGINNGPLLLYSLETQKKQHRYEEEWTTNRNTFSLWSGGAEFGTGRDGGCLNCGGLYFVRILEI